MRPSNPFQIPTCLQRADLQRRRQKLFRRAVVTTVVVLASLLVVSLIQGCVKEQAKTKQAANSGATVRLPH